MVTGFLIGLGVVVFTRWLPQPVGSIVFLAAGTIHFILGSRCAARMGGMTRMSVGYAVAALTAGVLAGLELSGLPLRSQPLWWAFVALVPMLLAVLLIHLESKADPLRYARWSTHWDHAGLLDRFLFRQPPNLGDPA